MRTETGTLREFYDIRRMVNEDLLIMSAEKRTEYIDANARKTLARNGISPDRLLSLDGKLEKSTL